MGIMSLSEILDRSIDILKKHMKNIILFSLCYGMIYMLGVVVLVFGGGIFIAISTAILSNAAMPILLLGPIIFLVVIFLIAIVMVMASRVGVIKITSQEFSDEKVGLGEAMGATFKNLHRVLGIFIIQLLLCIPLLIVLGGVVYFIIKNFDAGITAIMATGAFGAREIALIILFIVIVFVVFLGIQLYYTWFSFSLQTAIIEKKGIIASVKRSFELIKGSLWRIFGTTLLIGLTIYAIQNSLSSFLTGLLSLIYLLVKFLKLPMDYITFINLTFSMANWPITIISWLIITPAGTIMTTLLYYNQRFKREGYDMVIRLRNIEKNDERKQSSELV